MIISSNSKVGSQFKWSFWKWNRTANELIKLRKWSFRWNTTANVVLSTKWNVKHFFGSRQKDMYALGTCREKLQGESSSLIPVKYVTFTTYSFFRMNIHCFHLQRINVYEAPGITYFLFDGCLYFSIMVLSKGITHVRRLLEGLTNRRVCVPVFFIGLCSLYSRPSR